MGLRALAAQCESALASVGLKPNLQKSATLRSRADGKKKRWYCVNRHFYSWTLKMVPALSTGKAYRYLGTQATLGEYTPDAFQTLDEGIKNVTKAPLKPQQRTYMLRYHLVPSLLHQLALEEKVTRKLLKTLDYAIQAAIRRWLRLAMDSPNSLFYAP
jgi:hypothetical protein